MSLSSSAFAISTSFFSFKARHPKARVPFNIQNPLRCSSPPSIRPLSRKLYPVKATVLQEDDEEEVVVEKSFPTKIPLGLEIEEVGESRANSSSSGLERRVIKVEQSVNIFLTDSVIKILDTLYRDRDYARFFVLETIARVPYFAFISVLHLYESFGWWRRADYLKVHFAESWNEMHHLLIMEELGGNSWWFDRFLAQHIAVFYYFMTVFMYALSPRMACKYIYLDFTLHMPLSLFCTCVHAHAFLILWPPHSERCKDVSCSIEALVYTNELVDHFSECVESHAFETYDKFIKAQGDELRKKPAPEVAIKYYTGGDLYLFDEFQTSRAPCSRRPKIDNLYDVFVNIRDDEAEHCKTMKACQTHGNLQSPHSYADDFEEMPDCMIPEADCEGIVDCIKNSFTPTQAKQTKTVERNR